MVCSGTELPPQFTPRGRQQLLMQLRSGCYRKADFQLHTVTMLNPQQLAADVTYQASRQTFMGVGQFAQYRLAGNMFDFLGLQQGLSHRIGIGPYETTSTQLDSAVITHHGRQYAIELLMAQHLEHRTTSRPGRLTIIHRGTMPARQQCPAYMGGIRVLGAQFRDPGLRTGPVGYRFNAGDKSAFADFQNVGNGMGKAIHGKEK